MNFDIFNMINYFILNFSLVCFISFILVIWFESDIVNTISKLTNTRKLLRIPDYEKYKIENDPMCSYPNFLNMVYPSWITKLLSCPICLCFWSTLISLATFTTLLNFPSFFGILLFPINYILSLLLYLNIRKLL